MKKVSKETSYRILLVLSLALWTFSLMRIQFLDRTGQITAEGLNQYEAYCEAGSLAVVYVLAMATVLYLMAYKYQERKKRRLNS